MACLTDCHAPMITRDYLYRSSWDLRNRAGWSGQYGVHGSAAAAQRFNAAFHRQVGRAINTINTYAHYAGYGSIQWIGNVGAAVCKPGCHSSGRALDVTAMSFDSSSFDLNVAWRSSQSIAQQRGYLAIWAGLRIYCKTVLTNSYNSAHRDHIHIDNDGNGGSAPPAIRTSARTDTTLIQTACKLLDGATLSVDGIWGPATTRAYDNLLDRLNMNCLSPKTNYWHARTLLILITRHGFASRSAGTYRYLHCR